MTLKDFIDEYVEHNSLVRVLYKNTGGHKLILDNWDDVAMDWEIVKGQGKYAPYINHKVIGITSILTGGPYPESINIVIEEIPLDQLPLCADFANFQASASFLVIGLFGI